MKKHPIIALLLCCLFGPLFAQNEGENTDRSLSPYFLVTSKTGSQTETMPLRATSAVVNIAGGGSPMYMFRRPT